VVPVGGFEHPVGRQIVLLLPVFATEVNMFLEYPEHPVGQQVAHHLPSVVEKIQVSPGDSQGVGWKLSGLICLILH
jgi:hypothetical protein